MKSYIIIGIALLFCGCSIKKDITGKYMSKSNPNYLQFRENNTFIYEYRAQHLYQQSIGKWEKGSKNLVILNSEIKSTAIPLNVSKLNKINGGNNISIKLNIMGNESLSDYQCIVFVNDVKYCLKRCDSLTAIPVNSPIKSIYFMFIREPKTVTTTYIPLPLTTNKYIPDVKNGNNLEVKVNFNDIYFYYKAFNNEKLKIKGDGIKIFNSYKGKWEKLKRVPDSTNIFSRYNDKSVELDTF